MDVLTTETSNDELTDGTRDLMTHSKLRMNCTITDKGAMIIQRLTTMSGRVSYQTIYFLMVWDVVGESPSSKVGTGVTTTNVDTDTYN